MNLNFFRQLILVTISLTIAVDAFAQSVLVIGGAQTSEKNFAPYLSGVDEGKVRYFFPDTSPFTADHGRDLKRLQSLILDLPDADLPITVLAYSVGGKFALAAAESNPNISQMLLIDPVDGPPPGRSPSQRFPIYAESQSQRSDLEVVILVTELGAEGGFLGVPCVSEQYGPRTFLDFYSEAAVSFEVISDVGHTDILFPPLNLLSRSACKKGDGAVQGRVYIDKILNNFLPEELKE